MHFRVLIVKLDAALVQFHRSDMVTLGFVFNPSLVVFFPLLQLRRRQVFSMHREKGGAISQAAGNRAE